MNSTIVKIKLISGECLKLNSEEIRIRNHRFIRLGKRLVASVLCSSQESAIYVWREIGGIYYYLGEINFQDRQDSFVMWNVYPCAPEGEPMERAKKFLSDQCGHHGNSVKMLSVRVGPLNSWKPS